MGIGCHSKCQHGETKTEHQAVPTYPVLIPWHSGSPEKGKEWVCLWVLRTEGTVQWAEIALIRQNVFPSGSEEELGKKLAKKN